MRSAVLSIAAALVVLALMMAAPSISLAAQGDCGQPLSTGAAPTASDCLFILRSAVGSQTCDPICVCDANGAGGVSATDALLCLKAAVAEPVTLSCPCTVVGEASLAFAINPNPALPGETLEVQLTVTNTGIIALASVQVDLSIPEPLESFSLLAARGAPVACIGPATANSCSPGETVRWSIGSLASGEVAVLSIPPRVIGDPAPAEGAQIAFSASVSAAALELATAQATVFVDSQRSLDLSLDDDRDPVAPSGTILYRLSLGNRGPVTSENTVLRMPLPAGTSFVSASDNGVPGAGDVVEWQLGDLAPGVTWAHELVVTADGFGAEGGEITATATLENLAGESIESVVVTAVREEIPLAVTMTLVPDPAEPGEPVSGTVTVSNQGAFAISDVTVEVTLPQSAANFFLVDVSGAPAECVGAFTSGTCSSDETLEWSVGTLEAGASVTLTMPPVIGANETPGTILTLEARARDGGNYDVGARESVRVVSTRLLDLAIEDDVDPAAAGTDIRYTLSYGNLGVVAVDVFWLRVPLPDGATFNGALDGGVLVGDAVEWDIGTLSPGETGTREMWLRANAGLAEGAIVSVEAQLDAETGGLSERTRAAADTRIKTNVPLALTMELNPDPAVADGTVVGVLTATNTSDVALAGVEVEVILPQELGDFPLAVTSGGTAACLGTYVASTCDAGERLVWTIGDLAAGDGVTLSMPSKMDTALTAGTIATFAGRARASGGDNVAVNESVRVETARKLDLSIADGDGDPALAGGEIAYRLSAGNPTGTLADNVTLRLQIPDGATFVSASDGGALDGSAIVDGVVAWDMGPLDPGATRTRECIVQLAGDLAAGSILQARAQIEDDSRSRTQATAATRIEDGVTLVLTVELGPDPAAPAEIILGVITATNTGLVALDGVEVEVMLPEQTADFYLIGASGGTAQCVGPLNTNSCATGERLVWTVGTLAAGAGVTLTMPPLAKLATSGGSVMTFEARARATGGVNTGVRASARIETARALEIALEDGAGDPATAGSQLTYVIHLGNPTGSSATNTVLRMPVPAGTTFVSASDAGVLGGDGVVEWSIGTLVGATNGTRTLTVDIDAGLGDGAVLRAVAEIDDNAGSRAQAAADTRIEADSPLTLSLSLIPDQAASGAAIAGTLAVSNSGLLTLSGVEVEVILPAEVATFSLAGTTGAAAVCAGTFTPSTCAAGERLVFAVGTLAGGADATLTFPPKIAAGIASGSMVVFEARARATGGASAAVRDTMRVVP